MSNIMKKAIFKGILLKHGTEKRIRDLFSNERGAIDPVIAIIFGAILILAVLATQPTVNGIFTDFVDDFQTWMDTKKSTLFS